MSDEEAEVEQALEELAARATAISYDDIPEAIARRAAVVVIDDLAAAIAAREEPEVRALQSALITRGRLREATIFRGGRARTDHLSAALANAVAANWQELDEGYSKVACHGGLYTVPAVVAEAELEATPMAGDDDDGSPPHVAGGGAPWSSTVACRWRTLECAEVARPRGH